MKVLRPTKLIKGDIIGVIAPSGIVDAKELESGTKILKEWGFKIELGKHIMKRVDDYSAGTPEERREDFEKMVKDPKIKAIACASGGYAASSVIPTLSQEVIRFFKKHPPLLFGYSDFCLFLNSAFSLGISGLHAPNVVSIPLHQKESQESLRKALLGEMDLNYGPRFFRNILIPGKAKGYFLPTNLDELVHLFGSKFDPFQNFDGPIILGLEEVWEDKSNVKRMLEKIIFHRNFKKIKGIILGRFVGNSEAEYPKWGKKNTWSDIFISALKNKNIPVVDFPHFGHMEEHKKMFKILRKKPKIAYNKNIFLSFPTGVKAILNADYENPYLKFLDQAVE